MEAVQQRIAVVTGANRGIGFEISKQLAARGVHVVLTARNEVRGREAVERVTALGHSASFAPLDVTSDASAAALAEHVRQNFGRLDILVNNAGVALDKWVPSLEVKMDALRQTFETNVFGVVRVCQALLPIMKAHGHGRVVNVSSTLGSLDKMAGISLAYRSSKTALNAITRALAAELKHDDILVNSMCPGWVRTELGGERAPRAPAEAVDTAIWLCTLPTGGPSGGFYQDRAPVPW